MPIARTREDARELAEQGYVIIPTNSGRAMSRSTYHTEGNCHVLDKAKPPYRAESEERAKELTSGKCKWCNNTAEAGSGQTHNYYNLAKNTDPDEIL